MHIPMLLGKIHRARVTAADLDYPGSITVDRTLMDRAGLICHQQVQVYNITNGARFETYVIEGAAGSGAIQINGAAAHLAGTGDLVIIAAYGLMPREAAETWQPKVVLVDDQNRPKPAEVDVTPLRSPAAA